MDRIKLRITVVIALAVFLLKGTDTFAQQTDPTLTGAVFAQTSTRRISMTNARRLMRKSLLPRLP
jgi:hypothetical protein